MIIYASLNVVGPNVSTGTGEWRMAREPYDVFIREFLQHPAWEEVLGKLQGLAKDLEWDVFRGTKETFDERVGKAKGVYEAISLIRGLIEKSKDKTKKKEWA